MIQPILTLTQTLQTQNFMVKLRVSKMPAIRDKKDVRATFLTTDRQSLAITPSCLKFEAQVLV